MVPGVRRRSAHNEKGFTLIELLIVTSVMPIIVGAITAGLVAVLSLQTATTGRIGDSGNAQIASSTFIKDVQSATFITTDATTTPQCGDSSLTQLLGLQWGNTPADIANDVSSNPSTLVSYVIVPATDSSGTTTYSLVREYCTLGNFTTPVSSTVVSDDIAGPAVQPPPCVSSAGCNPYDTSHNPPIGWTSSSAVPLVKFEIKELLSGFDFTMTANSLAWTPPGAGGTVSPPFSPLTLLSQASGVGSSLSMQAGSVLNITGTGAAGTTIAVASPNDSSVSIPGDAAVSASSVFTEDPNLASLAGAGLGFATPEYYASSVPDPLSSLFNAGTAPPATSSWPLSPVSCSVTGSTYNCPAGLYNSDPNFPSGSTVNFSGFGGGGGFGDYEFANTLKIPSNSTITFNQGEYVFDGTPAITPDVVQSQTLTYTSTPPASPAVNGTYTPTATASSGLTPTFAVAGNCSITAGVVKFTANGTCLVNATQPGNATYGPADQIQQVISIPKSTKTAQTITYTSTQPASEAINATYTPTATASSGLTPTFAVVGPCSINVATNVVTFTGAGTCDINASQSGNTTYFQAPVNQQAIVVIAGTGVTSITGNNVLFYVPPTGGSVNFGANTSVQLTPLGSGLAIWDASSNSATTVTITNVATSRNTYGGIYIPGGSVNVTSSSFTGSMSVMFIVAQSVNMAQQLTLNVTGP
jgi:prepilin-type N-terminal cleavage/methylation domain-containing protein